MLFPTIVVKGGPGSGRQGHSGQAQAGAAVPPQGPGRQGGGADGRAGGSGPSGGPAARPAEAGPVGVLRVDGAA